MSAHTPGPWTVFVDRRQDGDVNYIAGYNIEAGPRWIVGDEGICANPDDAANARLIAAAPDLLEALRNLEGQAVMQNKAYGNPGSPSMNEALTEARAAIAKATQP